MKYASEIIELMSAYPDRIWRISHLIRAVRPAAKGKERVTVHHAVLRVLNELERTGHVSHERPQFNGSFSRFRWKTVTRTSENRNTQSPKPVLEPVH